MNVRVGDKVRFLNDIGGGIISKIVNKNIVNVTNDDGFDIPTLITDLVVVEQAKEKEAQAKEPKVEETPEIFQETFEEKDIIIEGNDEVNAYFAFIPKDPGNIGNCNLETYLVNDSNYRIMYNILKEEQENYSTFAVGMLEPNTKVELSQFDRNDLNSISSLHFQFILYRKGTYKPISPIENSIKIQAVKFYKENSYKENDFFNDNAIIYTVVENSLKKEVEKLTEVDIKKIIKEKQESEKYVKDLSQKYTAKTESPIIEVDLHIQEILDDFKGYSNAEILNVQMNHFRLELEKAIKEKVKKIVFIHGIGNGTLKQEIRKELDRKKFNYQDASFKEYGYGATMVILK